MRSSRPPEPQDNSMSDPAAAPWGGGSAFTPIPADSRFAVIDDADVPLLAILVVASMMLASPSLDVLFVMAATSVTIGGCACLAHVLLRRFAASRLGRSRIVRAAPLLVAALLLACRAYADAGR
jgi:hypothetical protein